MRKVSIASLVAAIVLIVLAITACCYGFYNIDGYRTSYVNAWRIRTTVFHSSNLGLGLVLAGGFLFVGGILLLLLSVVAYDKAKVPCDDKKCCCDSEEKEEPQNPVEQASITDAT